MDDIQERILGSRLKGNCCSQIIMDLALEDIGRENEELVSAMGAFCNGMGHGKICGILASAIAVLHVADTEGDVDQLQEDYMNWFEDAFGAYDCGDLVGNDPEKRMTECPRMILESYVKLHGMIVR
jgi:hypothetical protein